MESDQDQTNEPVEELDVEEFRRTEGELLADDQDFELARLARLEASGYADEL